MANTKGIIEKLATQTNIIAPLTFTGDFDSTKLAEMLRDPIISKQVQKIQDYMLSTKVVVETDKLDEKSKAIAKTFERDMNALTNQDMFKKELTNAVFRGHTFNELIFGMNKDGNLVPKELQNLPAQYVRYDYTEHRFYVVFANNKTQWLDAYEDMMTSVYQPILGQPYGLGMLEEIGITKLWEQRNATEAQLNALVKKYGGVMTFFSYDPAEAETDEGMATLKERVKGIQATQDGSVMAVPVGGYNSTLKDSMDFITLDKLNPQTIQDVLKFYDNEIEALLSGGVESSSDGGSYAREEITSQRQARRAKRFIRFAEQEYARILATHCEMAGVDPVNFELRLERVLEGYELLEKQTSEANRDKALLENTISIATNYEVIKGAIADMKASGLTDEYIASKMNLDLEMVKAIEGKALATNTAKAIAEFSKKLNIK